MKISIKKIIIPSIPSAIFLLGCCVVLWAFSYFSIDLNQSVEQSGPKFVPFDKYFVENSLLANLLCIVLSLLNAFLLEQLSTKYSLIRTRTFLPIFNYVLLMAVWSLAGITFSNHIALTFLIVSLFNFMNMYRDKQAVEKAFTGSLTTGIAGFFSFEFMLLLPAFWIGFVMFQSFSLRTFLASVFGAITPWILYFSVRLYFQPDGIWFDYILSHLDTGFVLKVPSIHLIIYIASLFIILLIGLTGLYNNLQSDSIQTRQSIKIFVVLFFTSLIIAFIFSAYSTVLLPLIALSYSMIISHPLSLQKNNFYSILFIVFCTINIFYVLMNYFFSIQ